MTALPKRGDLVRVTWAHQHSSLKVGSEVVLSSHGYAVDPANELYRPTPPPDCVSFMYADADHRERGSHAVKVEILERAGECPKCWKGIHPGQPGQCSNCGGTGQLPAPEPRAVHPELARGMRMALEIALEVTHRFGRNDIGRALKEAVEKELAKA